MWENNVKFIEQHNIEAANGLHTFNVGENEFADWTTVEFVKYFNGLNMSLSQRDFMENDKNNQMIRDLPDQVDWRDKVEYNSIECTVSSIYRLHILRYITGSPIYVFRDIIHRVLFYIKITVIVSDSPHKVLKLVIQAMVEIFANFIA